MKRKFSFEYEVIRYMGQPQYSEISIEIDDKNVRILEGDDNTVTFKREVWAEFLKLVLAIEGTQ